MFPTINKKETGVNLRRIMDMRGVKPKDIQEYFGEETLRVIVRQPLTVTETATKFDVDAKVTGGGFSGQAGAVLR